MRGSHHAHFTVAETHGLPLPSGFKVTEILLEGDDRTERDIMLTRYYGGMTDIQAIASAKGDAACLRQLGFTVERVKLEVCGHMDGTPLCPSRYAEGHIKLRIPDAEFEEVMERLRPLQAKMGFRLSQNPRERRDGITRQFANVRIRDAVARSVTARPWLSPAR
jgi:hypothetical protein